MKKILTAALLVLLVSALSVGAVMAEEEPPTTPTTPGGKTRTRDNPGNRVLADYTNQAIADLLGIKLEEYNAYKESGATLYDIAADLGIDTETLATLHVDARELAYEAALADGMIADREYQYFQSRIGNGQGGWRQGGRGHGDGNGGGQGGGGMFDGLCESNCECDGTGMIEPTP